MADHTIALERFVIKPGFGAQIMNTSPVMSVVSKHTSAVQARATAMGSASYASDVQPGKVRCHGIVYTPDLHAMRSNAKHNSLAKGLYGG